MTPVIRDTLAAKRRWLMQDYMKALQKQFDRQESDGLNALVCG